MRFKIPWIGSSCWDVLDLLPLAPVGLNPTSPILEQIRLVMKQRSNENLKRPSSHSSICLSILEC